LSPLNQLKGNLTKKLTFNNDSDSKCYRYFFDISSENSKITKKYYAIAKKEKGLSLFRKFK